MIRQRALLVLALVAGALAGGLYYLGAQRTTVIVAARDLDATHALASEDLTAIALPPDAVPRGALADLSSALGRVPRAPLWKGQVLLTEGLADRPATFHTGLALPAGMRAVALPLSAAQAVGGTVVPGVLVDVLAVPIAGRAPAGRPTEILAQAALLLDVRSETGAAFGPQSSKAGLATVSERIGSVVIAIDRAEEIRFADRIATSTFVLTLVPSR